MKSIVEQKSLIRISPDPRVRIKGWAFLFFILFISFNSLAYATANFYYVDYVSGSDTNPGTKASPWQHAPGMQGFAGTYTHVVGDHFIFKGGVTWPSASLPLTVHYSGGGTGSEDVYTVDKTWYSGSQYSYPIFDGQLSMGSNNFLIGDNSAQRSYLIIDGLKLLNVGNPTDATGTAIAFNGGGSDITVRNSWLQPESIESFSYSINNSNSSGLYFYNNHISDAGRATVYGQTGYVLNDLEIHDNVYDGPASLNLYSYHLDGFMIGNPATADCASNGTATITNILFYNNYFDGDWSQGATAQLYSNGCTSGTKIYNNVFAYENTSCAAAGGECMSPGFVVFNRNDQNINIYNNTFSNDADPGYSIGTGSAVTVDNPAGNGNVNIEGNIFSGIGNVIVYENVNTININYNLYNEPAQGTGRLIWNAPSAWQCYTLADCQSHGMEMDSQSSAIGSSLKYAGFVALPDGNTGSGNWYLQSGSPAINASINLSSNFSTDINGNSRPVIGNWTIGAYQYSTAHYVYCGATGSGNGSEWTDAYTDLPANLLRGDTYVIAGSNSCQYASHSFNDAESSSSVITIRKAESSLDSGVPGWDPSFATAQAVWNDPIKADPQQLSTPGTPLLSFCQSYYTVDGISGSTVAANPGGQGFLVQSPAPSYHGLINISNNAYGCTVSTSSTPKVLNNISIHHVEVSGVQNYYQVPVTACSYNSGTATITTGNPGWQQGWVVGDMVSGFNSANNTNEITDTAILTANSNTFTVATSPNPCSSLAFVVLEPVGSKGVGAAAFYATGPYTSYNNLDLSDDYIHTNGRDNIDLVNSVNTTIDHDYSTGNESNHESHGQPMQIQSTNGLTVSNNSFVDMTGTAILFNSAGSGNTNSSNWNVFGNLIYDTGTNPYITSFGISAVVTDNCSGGGESGIHGMNFYNNTIANMQNSVDVGLVAQGYPNNPCSSGWVVENNLWWNDIQAAVWNIDGTSSHDYNTFLNTPLAYLTVQATHEYQTNSGSSSPFISSSGFDNFNLSNPASISYLTGGKTLGSPYNIDPNGNTRGADGNWYVGAYQYGTGFTTPPTVTLTSPTNSATYSQPVTITLSANASAIAANATINQVSFYDGSTLLGVVTASPYTITWNSVSAGTYNLKAIAYDSNGNSTVSASVTITVSGQLGDANNDGYVTIYDSMLTVQGVLGLPVTINTTNAEIDGTGILNIYDAYLISEYVGGSIGAFSLNKEIGK